MFQILRMKLIRKSVFCILSFYYLVVLVLAYCCEAGKISASLDTVELSDFRFGLGVPYVTFYENENFRGKLHYVRLSLQCTNVQNEYDDWASSIHLNRRCVTICDEKDCKGKCVKVQPSNNPTHKGVLKLNDLGLNDKVSSIKFCYS